MAVRIGHASIDERGRGRNGAAGDQTGREVFTRNYYNMGINVVLRPKSAAVAEKSAKACEAGCANNHIGYDMDQRNTLHTQAQRVNYDLSKVNVNCESDCSEFMTICAIAGGVKSLEHTGNAPTTSTMRRAFSESGAYEVLTDKKYTGSSDYLKRGDICVAEGHHTFMILSNGAKVSSGTGGSSGGGSSHSNVKLEGAKSKDNALTGAYKVTASSLNLRMGAGTSKTIITSMPAGAKVNCYGYYTTVSGVKWLLIAYKKGNVTFTGYASIKYLKRV